MALSIIFVAVFSKISFWVEFSVNILSKENNFVFKFLSTIMSFFYIGIILHVRVLFLISIDLIGEVLSIWISDILKGRIRT